MNEKNTCTFDGRPCPPEFKASLENLRKAGILDSPEYKRAFIRAAHSALQASKAEWSQAVGPSRQHRFV